MILKGLACAGREVLDRLEHAAIFLLPDHDAPGRSLLGDFAAVFELVVQQGRARLLPAVAAAQRVARGGEQDRQRVAEGTSVYGRVECGGGRIMQKKKRKH